MTMGLPPVRSAVFLIAKSFGKMEASRRNIRDVSAAPFRIKLSVKYVYFLLLFVYNTAEQKYAHNTSSNMKRNYFYCILLEIIFSTKIILVSLKRRDMSRAELRFSLQNLLNVYYDTFNINIYD
jgi:hypothetical protein